MSERRDEQTSVDVYYFLSFPKIDNCIFILGCNAFYQFIYIFVQNFQLLFIRSAL